MKSAATAPHLPQGTSFPLQRAPAFAKVSVAPMMDWTDRHCRYFLRLYSPFTGLYTEMIHANAILRGDGARLLQFSPEEQPLAIQLGGSEPEQLAEAARRAEAAGYAEVNLNCGCPSDRVRAGTFGACLMLRPALVAECVAAMKQAVRVPVTVKFRIGVVDREAAGGAREALARGQVFDAADEAALQGFARGLLEAGADALVVHARKAVLGGLSPHENRTVPPLRPDVVAALRSQLRGAFPGVPVVLNGGLRTAQQVLQALTDFDGVMIGREAYHRPQLLAELHRALHPGAPPPPGPAQILAAMREYARREAAAGTPLNLVTRHMLGMHSGRPGARALRQVLSQEVLRAGVDEVFDRARDILEEAA
jgi:tRNA-dihydrouridine synthase A